MLFGSSLGLGKGAHFLFCALLGLDQRMHLLLEPVNAHFCALLGFGQACDGRGEARLAFFEAPQPLLGVLLGLRQLPHDGRQGEQLVGQDEPPRLGPPLRALLEQAHEVMEILDI